MTTDARRQRRDQRLRWRVTKTQKGKKKCRSDGSLRPAKSTRCDALEAMRQRNAEQSKECAKTARRDFDELVRMSEASSGMSRRLNLRLHSPARAQRRLDASLRALVDERRGANNSMFSREKHCRVTARAKERPISPFFAV